MKEALNKINNKWVRLIALFVVFINTSGLIMGYQLLPFDNEQLVNIISLVALFLTEIWNHWKNNSYTHKAKKADEYLLKMKETK